MQKQSEGLAFTTFSNEIVMQNLNELSHEIYFKTITL
jgi:hypothetical protein